MLHTSLRSLLRNFGFTLSVSGALALGIGLAVALSSAADAILFRPLPVPRPKEIVRVYSTSQEHSRGYMSYLDYQDLAHNAQALLLAQTQIMAAVDGGSQNPRMRMGLAVSVNYFAVLGIRAQRGRLLESSDARALVVVLSHSLWRTQFHGDPAIVGQSIEIAKTLYAIVGIAPPEFGMDRFLHEDFYVPIEAYATGLPGPRNPLPNRSRRFLAVYARNQHSASVTQAELNARAVGLEKQFPESNRGQRVLVLPELAARMQESSSIPALAGILLVLAALAFLAACASASGLLLMREQQRSSEMALRNALGAGVIRLWMEALTESVLLAMLGAALGIPLAWSCGKWLASAISFPSDLPIAISLAMDERMFLIATACAGFAAMLCSLGRLRLFRQGTLLASATRITAQSKLREQLVIAQISLAVSIVIAGALLFHSTQQARQMDLGYRLDHVLLMAFDPAQVHDGEPSARAFYQELLTQTRLLPGVGNVALAQSVPMGTATAQKEIALPGAGRKTAVWSNIVTPGYFALLRIPLLAGRDFTADDRANGLPVVILNEVLAKTYVGAGRPVQQCIGSMMEIGGTRSQIIGVAQTIKYFRINEAPQAYIYVPFSQNYVSRMNLHVETPAAPLLLAGTVLAKARAINRLQPISDVRTLEDAVTGGALFTMRIGSTLAFLSGTSILALALAGLYASMTSNMRQRRRELAIRQALGASRRDILRLAGTRGLRLSLAGNGLGGMLTGIGLPMLRHSGLVTAFGNTGTSESASASLLTILASAMLAMLFANLVACFVPVWKNTRIDPAIALRDL